VCVRLHVPAFGCRLTLACPTYSYGSVSFPNGSRLKTRVHGYRVHQSSFQNPRHCSIAKLKKQWGKSHGSIHNKNTYLSFLFFYGPVEDADFCSNLVSDQQKKRLTDQFSLSEGKTGRARRFPSRVVSRWGQGSFIWSLDKGPPIPGQGRVRAMD
jgi:hypothetical protein